MLDSLVNELSIFIERSKYYLIPWIAFTGGLWIFNIFNWMTGSRLNILGIYPRHAFGLIGIIFCPLLHQNFNHLFFNSIPLFVLGLALLARGLVIFCWVTLIVTLLGGFAVWLVGRRSIHIGASGLISGYFGFILVTAYLQPSFTSAILAALVLYYFGGIFMGIFPQEERVSWESHLCGFLAGIASAYLPQYGLGYAFYQLSAFLSK
jgi:membrane associated rhomboid family serine protease